MVIFLYMIVAERNDYFSLMNDDGYKRPLFKVEVFQRDTDIGISFTGYKFNGFCLSADKTVGVRFLSRCC